MLVKKKKNLDFYKYKLLVRAKVGDKRNNQLNIIQFDFWNIKIIFTYHFVIEIEQF